MDCPDGHQWHDLADRRICAACLLEAPALFIVPEPADDPKRNGQTERTPQAPPGWSDLTNVR